MKRLDFPVCLHIIARRRAIKVLEHGAEAGWVGETAAKHDVCYRLVRVGQQLFGILQTGIADEGMWCLVGQLLHSAVQMHTAQSYFSGNHIHTQVLIIHVIIDYLHHLFHPNITSPNVRPAKYSGCQFKIFKRPCIICCALMINLTKC